MCSVTCSFIGNANLLTKRTSKKCLLFATDVNVLLWTQISIHSYPQALPRYRHFSRWTSSVCHVHSPVFIQLLVYLVLFITCQKLAMGNECRLSMCWWLLHTYSTLPLIPWVALTLIVIQYVGITLEWVITILTFKHQHWMVTLSCKCCGIWWSTCINIAWYPF